MYKYYSERMVTKTALRKRLLNESKNNISYLPWCSKKAAPDETSKRKILEKNLRIRGLRIEKEETIFHNDENSLKPAPITVNSHKQSHLKCILITTTIFAMILCILFMNCSERILAMMQSSNDDEKIIMRHESNPPTNNKKRIAFLLSTLRRAKQALRQLHKTSKILEKQNIKINSQSKPYMPFEIDYASSAHGGYTEALPGVHTQEGRAIVIQGLWGSVKLWNEPTPPPARLNTHSMWPPVPGDCWPMKGYQGGVIINLWAKIYLQSVSILHIKPDLQRSAPKDFELYVILDNGMMKFVAKGQYEDDGNHWQKFLVKSDPRTPIQAIAIRIISNQGNSKHTCIYRIQVHGLPAN